MNSADLLILLFGVSALFSFLNHRFLKLPFATASMLMAILLFGCLWAGNQFFPLLGYVVQSDVSDPDYYRPFLKTGIGFLLFISALQVKTSAFSRLKWPVFLIYGGGILLSALLAGIVLYLVLQSLDYQITLFHSVLFGMLILPADPVTLKPLLYKAGIRGNSERVLIIESLIAGIVGVTGFSVMMDSLMNAPAASPGLYIIEFFGVKLLGAVLLGIVTGVAGRWVLKHIFLSGSGLEVFMIPVMITGTMRLAVNFGLFWPFTMVLSGFIIRTGYRKYAFFGNRIGIPVLSDLLYELFTNMFFLMAGFALLAMKLPAGYFLAGGIAVVIVLFSRVMGVLASEWYLFNQKSDHLTSVSVFSWSSIRGGVPLALVLMIPEEQVAKDLLLVLTSCVVVFSVLLQGSSLHLFLSRVFHGREKPAGTDKAA